MTKIEPLNDKVVVRKLEVEAKSTGGIILSQTQTERVHRGEVIATMKPYDNQYGTTMRSKLKVGQIVAYHCNVGADIKIDGEDLVVMSETDVLMVLTKTNDPQ